MSRYYIKIIVEGDEENAFFDIVKSIGKDEKIVLDIENANGYGGIANAFLSALREDNLFDCIVCVYDVDNRIDEPNSPYNSTRKQLTSLFGDENITDAVSFCTNPNILQYFLLAADSIDKVALTSTSKVTNTSLVHKYWQNIASGRTDKQGRKIKSDYDASNWQLEIIKYSILNNEYEYSNLLCNASSLSLDYKKEIPSGNLLPMLIALKNGNADFFKAIYSLIEKMEC